MGQAIEFASRSNRVLLVDDDRLLSEQMSYWFSEIGCFPTAVETVANLKDQEVARFQSVLVDLALAGASGYDVLLKLRQAGFPGHVIIVSGMHQNLIEHAVQFGNNLGLNVLRGFQKPLLYDEVVEITELMRGKPSLICRAELQDPLTSPELMRHIADESIEFLIQPIISASTGRLVGGELLARAKTKRGLLSVAPAIESLPQFSLYALTDLALRTADRMIRSGAESAPDLRLSVNVPSSLIETTHFPELVRKYRHGAQRNQIVLELCEVEHMVDLDAALRNMRQAIANGFQFSLDDFGRLRNNLDRLITLPLAELKIDRLFVSEADTCERKKALCNCVSGLAHDLGIRVVAEGVETQEEEIFFKNIGVDLWQGYWESPPLTEESFGGYVRQKQTGG